MGQGVVLRTFLDIYNLGQQQEAIVAEVYSKQVWNLTFRRLFNDWLRKLSSIEHYPNLRV